MNSKVTQKNKQYSKEKKNTKAVHQRKKKKMHILYLRNKGEEFWF